MRKARLWEGAAEKEEKPGREDKKASVSMRCKCCIERSGLWRGQSPDARSSAEVAGAFNWSKYNKTEFRRLIGTEERLRHKEMEVYLIFIIFGSTNILLVKPLLL